MSIDTELVELFTEGELWEIVRHTFAGPIPEPFFVGVVASAVLMVIYVNSRSVVLTAIVAMLSGGVIVEMLPPEVQAAGVLLIIAGVVAAGSSIYLGRNQPVRAR